MQHTKIRLVILDAYSRGYRVTAKGKLISPHGVERVIKVHSKRKASYPFFSISVATFIAKSKVFGIPVHKFAAYCFYKEESFRDGLEVRHVNGNVLDVSKRNIKLGTRSQNELDKPKAVRRRSAQCARMSQGSIPFNRRFTDAEVSEIRSLCRGGGRGIQSQQARRFKVGKTTISKIVRGESYAA